MIDNRDIIRRFIDDKADGDTFWYTELLDRRNNGASRFKMLRTFEHNSRLHFDEQMDTIAKLCEDNQVRAYTRLTPRSRRLVASHMLKRVAMEFADQHFEVMGRIYPSVVGSTNIKERRLWLFDVDQPDNPYTGEFVERLAAAGKLKTTIPSRKGYHIITAPFNIMDAAILPPGALAYASLHRDNPTNLYIPESAK